MNSIVLIQIGDIHFPDSKSEAIIDRKDDAFPQPIAEKIQITPFQVSFRRLAKECEKGVDGLLFCGDMTSRADMDAYRSFSNHLVSILDLKDEDKWKTKQIHVVPGNHDIERNFNDDNVDLYSKFHKIDKIWDEIGIKVFAYDKVRMTTISKNKNALRIYSLNSCIGCGEIRFFPDKIRKELVEILNDYLNKNSDIEAFDLVGEELDTPAFDTTHIAELSDDINKTEGSNASIVVSHHNILPQSVPRIAIYTEAVNSGLLRTELSRTKNTVLYCHGHIHTNPIEVVQDPTDNNGALVCISAPKITDGFNKVEIYFNKNKKNIGCKIIRFKVNGNSMHKKDEIKIPFYDSTNCDEVCSENLIQFIGKLKRDYVRIKDIKVKYKEHFKTNPHTKTLKNYLEEAAWYGLIKINDQDKEFKFWQIRGVL